MRLLISLFFTVTLCASEAWPDILGAVGLNPETATLLIGNSYEAKKMGFRATNEQLTIRRIIDLRRPQLEIYWSPSAQINRFEVPADARIFAKERWTNAPVMAGLRRENRIYLWLATEPGPHGFERYPYLLQALTDLGAEPPARSNRLWAFFDSSYRLRADPEVLARRWRKAGIAAIHVASWHYYESDVNRDAWLRRLIEVCHQNAILVYAWIELPHVSEKFWNDHPEWREKTALLGDAHLDWRKLMNMQNRECFRSVETGIRDLISRFDWDGVNLGELYFESLEGHSNPARFTPFNEDVRQDFRRKTTIDPIELFSTQASNQEAFKKFLDYRADLAHRMQEEWLEVLTDIRTTRPHLDLVLTHIDDQFDSRMRDLLGADAGKTVPLLKKYDFTFLVEDPATVWHLGPQRYPEIARRYQKLTDQTDRLAVDINIVERYQNVYPTKQQTGVELFQLIHLAAKSFDRVALYFENSILPPDLDLLSASSAVITKFEHEQQALMVEAPHDVLIAWKGPAKVNGKPWPLYDGNFVRLPAGKHRIESGEPVPQILDINAKVIRAEVTTEGVLLEYESRSRAIVVTGQEVRLLPAGRHTVYLIVATS